MDVKSPVPPIPWKKILFVLACAAVGFWAVGFLVGLVVRFAFGS